MGKLAFFNLADETGTIQLFIEKAVLEGGLQGRTISISKGARHCGKLSVPEGEHHPNSEGIKSPAAPEQSLSEILEDQEEEGPFCP